MRYSYGPQGPVAPKGSLGTTRVALACAVHGTIPKTATCAQEAELVATIDAVVSRNKAVDCGWLAPRRTSRQGSKSNWKEEPDLPIAVNEPTGVPNFHDVTAGATKAY